MFPLIVNSTIGVVKMPVEGRVNIIVPQYIRCPEICHLETVVMIYAMKKLTEDGYRDGIVWATVDVNSWNSKLDDARSYMKAEAGDLVDRDTWILVLDGKDKLEQLRGQLGVRAKELPERALYPIQPGL